MFFFIFNIILPKGKWESGELEIRLSLNFGIILETRKHWFNNNQYITDTADSKAVVV